MTERRGIPVRLELSEAGGNMAAEYAIDLKRRIVFTRLTGDVTEKEILQHCHALARDPRFEPMFDQLVDVTSGSLALIHYSELEKIRANDPFSASSRRALVTSALADYGVARMYQIMRCGSIQVCRTLEEGKNFLGLQENDIITGT